LSARGLTQAQREACVRSRIAQITLIELAFPEGSERLASTPFALDYGGYSWRGGIAGAVEPVKETGAQIEALKLTLSGVDTSRLAQVQANDYRGTPVTLYLLNLNPDTYTVEGLAIEWSGFIDTMGYSLVRQSDGRSLATVSATCEHEGYALKRPRMRRFTNEDHQARHPGDRFYEYTLGTAEFSFVWPSKEYGRQ
jgi:hypothetical protein